MTLHASLRGHLVRLHEPATIILPLGDCLVYVLLVASWAWVKSSGFHVEVTLQGDVEALVHQRAIALEGLVDARGHDVGLQLALGIVHEVAVQLPLVLMDLLGDLGLGDVHHVLPGLVRRFDPDIRLARSRTARRPPTSRYCR